MSSSSKMNSVQQLQMLRDFVGSSVRESDLTGALRACGYNVERAAQQLLTGEFQKTKQAKGPKNSYSLSSSSSGRSSKKARTQQGKHTPQVTPKLKKKDPPLVPTNSKEHHQTPSPSIATSTAPNQENHRQLSPTSFLLCRRWLSDCTVSCRTGSVDHKEQLSLEGGGLFFRGQNITGRLPTAVAAILRPLAKYIHITAEALMEERCIQQGQTLPIQLTIYVTQPEQLLQWSSTSKETSQFFQRQRKQKKSGDTLSSEEAAFQLLQWAEYGDCPDFEQLQDPTVAEATEVEDIADVDAEEEEDNESRTDEILGPGDSSNLPEATAPGFVDGISLRSYQKQALHFMIERETTGVNRAQMDEQLDLLRSLNDSTKSTMGGPKLPANVDIHCDVGPVLVSDRAAKEATTLDGQVNPVNHPLWKRRYLASPQMDRCYVFYVNELLRGASYQAPLPPQPCSGGILADAMGLGKTVMLMALILESKHVRKTRGTTLVVAKVSLLEQWESEIQSKTNLTCRIHYGNSVSRIDFDSVDVVITTYGTLQSEHRKKSGFMQHKWLRVVLDEAHCIRNQRTLASKACCELEAKYRWCVSGTIIQNSLDDVYGIVKFLRHEPWCWSSFWKAAITNQVNEKDLEKKEASLKCALDRIRLLLSPIMLRRTKDSRAADGKPILTLPPVETKIIKVEMTDDERDFYNALLDRSSLLFSGFVKAGTVSKSYFQIFSLLQRLRQACDHIALTVNSRFDESVDEPAGLQDDENLALEGAEGVNAGGLEKSFLKELLQRFAVQNSPPRKHSATTDDAEAPAAKRRISFASNVAVSLSQAVEDNSTHIEDECPICLENPKLEEAVLTPCAHIFCRDCLVGFLRDSKSKLKGGSEEDSPDGNCPSCQSELKASQIIAINKDSNDCPTTTTLLDTDLDTKPSATEQPSSTANQILEKAVSGTESSKLRAVFEELDLVWKESPGSKVLIFSHYLGFLDLLESRLRRKGVSNFRLDGSVSMKERTRVLEDFRKEDKEAVLVVSMTAGGEGLNIVAASTCFIIEPWWNSAKEDQCVNRIHRIGQTADIVRVRKFVVANSVEERIVELQKQKAFVANEIYSGSGNGDLSAASRLSLDDFRLIFKSG